MKIAAVIVLAIAVVSGAMALFDGARAQIFESPKIAPSDKRKYARSRELVVAFEPDHSTSRAKPKDTQSVTSIGVMEEGRGTAITIGEPLDPSDSSDRQSPPATIGIHLGEAMDPEDPSTWTQREVRERINVGESMDPERLPVWSHSDRGEAINIGEPKDPSESYPAYTEKNVEPMQVGAAMEPDDPHTWTH